MRSGRDISTSTASDAWMDAKCCDQKERRKSGAKFPRDKNGKLLPRAPRRGLSEVDDPRMEAAARLQARHRGKSTRQLLVRGTKHAYSANASRGHLEQDEHEALLGQMKATPAQVSPSRRARVSNLPGCRVPFRRPQTPLDDFPWIPF